MSSSLDFSRPSPVEEYYDVFLSFRGMDTRKGFTTNFYHALKRKEIHTFMDVHLVGERIDYLFEVIAKSRMAVVIYSENFASSAWCLKELDKILQLWKAGKKILLIPIFYKVGVSELKDDLTGKTGEYLNKHVAKHDESTVDVWKAAVRELGEVAGFPYEENDTRSEYDFIDHVIATIKEKLLTVRLQPTQDQRSIQSSQVKKQWPSSSSDQLGARAVDIDKKHHRVTVSGYVAEEKVIEEVKKTERAEKWPDIENHPVAYQHVAGAYGRNAPLGFVSHVPQAHADYTHPNRLLLLFSDENAQGCAIM